MIEITSVILAIILLLIVSVVETIESSATIGVLSLILLRLTDTSKNHMIIYSVVVLIIVMLNLFRRYRQIER